MRKNKKKDKNKEELKEYLKQISEKDSLSNEDAERLTNMIDELVFGSKTERIISLMAAFILKFVILYIVALIASAFFLEEFLLDRYYIFLIDGGIAFLLTIAEMMVGVFKHAGIKAFVFSLIAIASMALVFNYLIPTFTFGSVWIIYLIVIEVIYNLLMFTIVKKKLRS
jgi:hypothetical protein